MHAVDSHSFPFPFPSLDLITIPMGFPRGYSHLIPIPFPNITYSNREKHKQETETAVHRMVQLKQYAESNKSRYEPTRVLLQYCVTKSSLYCGTYYNWSRDWIGLLQQQQNFSHVKVGHSHYHLRLSHFSPFQFPNWSLIPIFMVFPRIPMGFPWELGIPFPWPSLLCMMQETK